MALPKSASSSRRKDAEILIADENPATLEFFSRLLEDSGFTTLTADSGEAVLRFLFGAKPLDERPKPAGGRVIRLAPQRPTRPTLISSLMNPEDEGLTQFPMRPIRAVLI